MSMLRVFNQNSARNGRLTAFAIIYVLAQGLLTNGLAQSTNILTNGGFELPQLPSDTEATLDNNVSYKTVMPGWTAGGNGQGDMLINGDLGGALPYEGNQFIGFSATGGPPGGSLSQTFQTSVGQNYSVSFAEAGSLPPPADRGDLSITVSLAASDGTILSTYIYLPNTDVAWTNNQLSFTATTTNTTITFTDTSKVVGNRYLLLDDVVVTQSNASPTLSISQTAGNLILSWPSTATLFQLQTSPSLSTNWTNVAATPVTNTSSITLTTPVSVTNGFFRLNQQ